MPKVVLELEKGVETLKVSEISLKLADIVAEPEIKSIRSIATSLINLGMSPADVVSNIECGYIFGPYVHSRHIKRDEIDEVVQDIICQ